MLAGADLSSERHLSPGIHHVEYKFRLFFVLFYIVMVYIGIKYFYTYI